VITWRQGRFDAYESLLVHGYDINEIARRIASGGTVARINDAVLVEGYLWGCIIKCKHCDFALLEHAEVWLNGKEVMSHSCDGAREDQRRIREAWLRRRKEMWRR